MTNPPIKDVPELRWVGRVTKVMDSNFTLPGTKFRFGIDPIIGLIPFVGDAVGFGVSFVLVMTMWKHGASGEVRAKMLINILLDLSIGSIPIIGSIFDFYYKSNQRNFNLLNEHYKEGKHQGNGKGILIAIGVILLIVIVLAVYLFIKLLDWIF